MTRPRQARLRAAVAQRTKSLTLVLEELTDLGNIKACLRTAESLGLLDIHIIKAPGPLSNRSGRTAGGATKWLNLHHWSSPLAVVDWLKQRDFQVIGLSLGPQARPLVELDLKPATAFVLGHEHRGLSQEMLNLVDSQASLPSRGLTVSYNVSVAAALALHTVVLTRAEQQGDLTAEEQARLLADYLER